MNTSRTSGAEGLKTDIVIIGGGGASLAAAVEAAQEGASVIILEERRKPGGNSLMAFGLFAAESPVQKRMGIDARRDDLFKKAMDYSHWTVNPRIVRAFVDKSGDTIRWLEEKGVKFDHVASIYPNQIPLTFHRREMGKAGTSAAQVLIKNCEDLGVRLLCKSRAKRILTSESGSVIGVLAVANGKEFTVMAKSVIIATGGYAGNKELLKKYCPSYSENMLCQGFPYKGDGLLMAMEIGAATEGLGTLEITHSYFPGFSHLAAITLQPNAVWVSKNGERFADETIGFSFPEYGNAVSRQPENTCYTLLDGNIKENIVEEGLMGGVASLGNLAEGLEGRGLKLTELEKELQSGADKEMIKISDSWDEIAKWIGVAPEVLKATIDEYNSFCDCGHDKIFAKEPRYLVALRSSPYYAIKCHSNFYNTLGGIKINHHMEALDHQDNPIRGLYAAGVDCGGWVSDTYCLALSGQSIGFALNSGRIAGENAAKYVLGK